MDVWRHDDNLAKGTPPPKPASRQFIEVASDDYYHLIALLDNGTALAWEYENQYQPDTVNIINNVPQPLAGTKYIAVSGASKYFLLLRDDGVIVRWNVGEDEDAIKEKPSPAGHRYIAIGTSDYYIAALREDGIVDEWNQDFEPVARMVTTMHNYKAISVGDDHVLCLSADGKVYGFGANDNGQSVLQLDDVYVAISAGFKYSLALTQGGEIKSWGQNDQGQQEVPPLERGLTYIAISANRSGPESLALRSDNHVEFWGEAASTWGEAASDSEM